MRHPVPMKYKYIIYAPPYDENGGGAIALHRLCHLINECGGEAYLHPFVPSFEVHHHNAAEIGLYAKAIYDASNLANYRINDTFRTPVLRPQESSAPGDDCIVVYPEIAFGNPLRAKNVVRWLLHNPGHHTGKIYFGSGEIYYRYADYFTGEFSFPGSEMADMILRVQYSPFELYQARPEEALRERAGTAYCIRKGKGRAMAHDTGNSVLIDGKSHKDIATIFKSVKQFISYDPQTYYSYLAVIAGCESVVVPPDDTSKEQWKPSVEDRYGLAYGFDDMEFALATRHLALQRQVALDNDSQQSVREFISDIESRLRERGT